MNALKKENFSQKDMKKSLNFWKKEKYDKATQSGVNEKEISRLFQEKK